MLKRRQFIKATLGVLGGAAVCLSPLASVVRGVLAKTGKIVLPRGTDRKTLVNKNPADLDTGNLETTPLKEFGVMGLSDHKADLEKWRLKIGGAVKKPLELSYEQILAMPPVERRVLLICPSIFVNHGEWKGVSMGHLLQEARAENGVTHVTVRGPQGDYEKTERFPMEDVLSNRVFLAYRVNGESLPQKHGFPLRLVAEGYYGYDWIKYVDSLTAEKVTG
ncbi:MAG: molybdopterin-dependent oxidoreductase [Thermodesulfobacteriota bacterium]